MASPEVESKTESKNEPVSAEVNVPVALRSRVISKRAADVTLELVEKYGDSFEPLTPNAERRLRWKLYLWIVGLVSVVNLWLFIDKATLAYGSLLGIFEETGLTDTEYNNLNTLFYTGYIIAQAPGHYLIQRLPLGKFVAATIFVWSLIVFLHCTAKSYGALIPLRFFLGFSESVLVPAMEMTMNMFFTPSEVIRVQPVFWIACMGSPIPAGFVAYGLLFSKSSVLPWKFFMIITGGVSFLLAIYSWFYYPDNPTKAKFLSLEEKFHTIQRVHHATKSSIEQKTFKPYQVREALTDPVSWLFTLAVFCLMIANNLAYQQNLLFLKIGVSDLGSTLVSVAGGGFAVVCCIVATIGLTYFRNRSAFWGTFWCLPAVAGGIGMVALDWDKKISLLACMLLAGNTFGITYIVALGWTSTSAGGYTKKLVRNVLWMGGYGVSNIISPQIWVARDAPRYYGAWIAQIVVSWVGTPLCLLAIHWILSRRNKERREWIAAQEALGNKPTGLVEESDDEGKAVNVEVDISLLDLTDLENKYFIYEL
ncbi:putative allantoate permease of the major facilitator superfamily [Lipomyces kononenkoae]|uniref:Allantoate permease of the major facilitator superfamily n=1 Tax=Lipomyces kononenkoae TaxID=34357 RepID=A0ACC3SQW1_LIPKO